MPTPRVFGTLYPTHTGPSVSVGSARWSVERFALKIGAEVVVCYPFSLPEGAQPARLTLAEGASRVYRVQGDREGINRK